MENEIKHLETFKAKAEGRGWPTTIHIKDTDWKIQADEPTEDGGSNSGPNPMQYFTASLASCQNEQAQVVAEELGLQVGDIDIDVEIDLDLGGFMGEASHSDGSYKEVRLSAQVKGDVTSEQAKAIGEKVDQRCPILGLLRTSGCEIKSNWSV